MSNHRLTAVGDGVSIGARVSGQGDPVILLHGVPGSAGVWDRVAESLAESFTVVVPDLLGFGASSRDVSEERLLVEGQAVALLALIDDLGSGPATLVGHDFGGPVALTALARRPEVGTRLVLSATNTFPDTPIPFPLSSILWPVVGPLARKAMFARGSLGMMLRQGVGRHGPRLDRSLYLGDARQSAAIATIFSDALLHLRSVYAPIEQILRRLEIPVLVLWGDSDPFFPLAQGRRTAEAAEAKLVVYEGAGHFLPEERAPEFAHDVEAFVRATRSARERVS